MNDTTLPIPSNKSKTIKKSLQRPRQKVGLRKGFALHDWKRLLLASNDLAQRKGQPFRSIKMSEIKTHDKVHDGWISLHGKVYNIGPYLHYHPGGVDIFLPCLGADASKLFDKFHRWVNIEKLVMLVLLFVNLFPHNFRLFLFKVNAYKYHILHVILNCFPFIVNKKKQ